MSFLMDGQTFGTIIFQEKNYKIFNQALKEEHFKLIAEYKKNSNGFISTGFTNEYQWNVINNKLYLTQLQVLIKADNMENELRVRTVARLSDDIIKEIFKSSKLFASWYSDSVKLLKNQKRISPNSDGRVEFEQEIIELFFDKGVLIDSKEYFKTYHKRVLKNYIQE